MGPPRYSRLLGNTVTQLPAHSRPLRLGIKSYFEGLSGSRRRELVWRFCHLARFMRIQPSRWCRAADRLFALGYNGAEAAVLQYREWLNRRDYSPTTIERLRSTGF